MKEILVVVIAVVVLALITSCASERQRIVQQYQDTALRQACQTGKIVIIPYGKRPDPWFGDGMFVQSDPLDSRTHAEITIFQSWKIIDQHWEKCPKDK